MGQVKPKGIAAFEVCFRGLKRVIQPAKSSVADNVERKSGCQSQLSDRSFVREEDGFVAQDSRIIFGKASSAKTSELHLRSAKFLIGKVMRGNLADSL